MPEGASPEDVVRAAIRAMGGEGSACFLRRSGSHLIPEGIAPFPLAADPPPVPLSVVIAGTDHRPRTSIRLLEGEEDLRPLRSLVGEGTRSALLTPISRPSLEGAHDLYALV